MNIKMLKAALAGLVLSVSVFANAGLIFDGGNPTLVTGNEMTNWLQVEDFSLLSNATLTSVDFWSLESGNSWDGTIEWFIFSEVSNSPSAILFSGLGTNTIKTDTGQDVFGLNQYSYTFDFDNAINLLASTNYWLGLHLSSDYSEDRIYWSTGDAQYNNSGFESSGGTLNNWNNNLNHHAFKLYNNTQYVPEPSTLAIFALGIMGLASRRFKKQ